MIIPLDLTAGQLADLEQRADERQAEIGGDPRAVTIDDQLRALVLGAARQQGRRRKPLPCTLCDHETPCTGCKYEKEKK